MTRRLYALPATLERVRAICAGPLAKGTDVPGCPAWVP